MKITELEFLKDGDYLIIETIPCFHSPYQLITMRVRFHEFEGLENEYAILSRGNEKKRVLAENIKVVGRYTASPNVRNGSHQS